MGNPHLQIAVTGADGQLGAELCRILPGQAIPILERDMDLRDRDAVITTIDTLRPDAVINTAAFTQVDRAEEMPEACRAVNIAGTRHLAEVCQSIGALLVQLSTDYVFFGALSRQLPFVETDTCNPQGVYAESKRASELSAQRCDRHLIIRTCGLYVHRTGEPPIRNFAKSVLERARTHGELTVVSDQHCTPSYVPHVATAVVQLLKAGSQGLFHVVNAGHTTWHGFAVALMQQAGLDIPVRAIPSSAFPLLAPRPSYSVLSTEKYRTATGHALPSWQEGVSEFVRAWATPTSLPRG